MIPLKETLSHFASQYGRKGVKFKFVGLHTSTATYRLRKQFTPLNTLFSTCEIGTAIITIEDCQRMKWDVT